MSRLPARLNQCYSMGTGVFFFTVFKWATHPNLMPRLKIVELSSAALCFFWLGLHNTAPSSDFSGSVSSPKLPVVLRLHDHAVQLQVCLPCASTFLVFPPSLYSLSGTLHLLLTFLVSSTFSFSHLFPFYLPPTSASSFYLSSWLFLLLISSSLCLSFIYSDYFAYRDHKVMKATPRLLALCERFREELVVRAEKVRASRPKYEPPPRKSRLRLAKHKCKQH